jgi:hypothetical protein
VAEQTTTDAGLRGAVRIVAVLNLGYFGIEFAVAAAIGSVSLFADSVDFGRCVGQSADRSRTGLDDTEPRGSEWRSPAFCSSRA